MTALYGTEPTEAVRFCLVADPVTINLTRSGQTVIVTTPLVFANGFSGNAHPSRSRYLPTAQSEPEDFQSSSMIPGN